MTRKTSSIFTICHDFALEMGYFPVLLSVRALLARLPKRNKRKVVSGRRVTLPVNFAYKPGLSFNPLARVTLAVGLPYFLVNWALNLPNNYKQHMAVCGLSLHQGSKESRKSLEQKFTFLIGILNPHDINERFSFN